MRLLLDGRRQCAVDRGREGQAPPGRRSGKRGLGLTHGLPPLTAEAAGAGSRGWGWAFIDLALLGRNTLRSYAVTLICVIVLPVLFLAFAFAAIFTAGALHVLTASGANPAVLAAAFATVVVAGLVLAWRVERSHRRPWLSLVSPDLRIDWKRFAIGASVEALLMLVLLLGAAADSASPAAVHRGPVVTLSGALAALVLTPFQAASEEMLFRGYLTQALGRLVRSRAVIVAVVGVTFAGLHLNAYGPLTLPYLLILSLVFSLASLRDGRLELAIGAHAANNWVAIGAAYALGASPTDTRVTLAALAALATNGVLFYALTRFLVRLFCEKPAAS